MKDRPKRKSALDELHGMLHEMPPLKKEAFVLLVRTKTRKDLKALKMQAFRNDEEGMVSFYEAAETLRTFVEAGVPITL